MLSSTSKKPETSKAAGSLDPQPVPLGTPKTSHYTVAFYQLCQERGFVPQFEIDGDEFDGFGGWLKVGNETIGSEERWRTKKSAKEGLAQKGLGIVKDMDARIKSSAAQASEKNWIGLLQGTLRTG